MAKRRISRRTFLEGTGTALAVAATRPTLRAQSTPPSVPRTTIRVTINGAVRQAEVEDRWTLAELLRDHLRLTGTKIGCDRGECGACTVLLDGQPVYSCSQLAVWTDGHRVETVEGLTKNGALDPLQQSFVDHGAIQCGFCTPGMVLTAHAFLLANHAPTSEQVRRAISANLCRCTGYQQIIDAVEKAAPHYQPETKTRKPAEPAIA